VDHEHGLVPLGDVIHRVELLDILRHFVRRASIEK
jgi:hypothetical protein